jgi:hypothetical protein
MTQPAKDWYHCDAADLLGPAKIRSIFIQREMDPDLIVVRNVSLQNVAQVRFAEHDEVVERFAAYRSDEAPVVAGTVCFIVLVSFVILVTLDLNPPDRGLITVSQEPMQRLLSLMSE